MADRAAKRMRRISTEYDESEGDGWDGRGNSRYVADCTTDSSYRRVTAARQDARGSCHYPRKVSERLNLTTTFVLHACRLPDAVTALF